MPNLQSPRGTKDILPIDQPQWQQLLKTAQAVAESMGFQAITTPTYEYRELFQRSIGQGTDIMDKELFLLRSQQTEAGKEEYALRPEGTAGIARAYIEHGMQTWPQPVKLYSIVNNFRYDRPQKGRFREHYQLDIELFGDPSPFADAWVISTCWRFFQALQLQNTEVVLNTLGTRTEREAYIQALKGFLTPLHEQLSEDSRQRIESNTLRILDSKDPADQAICQNAPLLTEYLGDESRNHFKMVQELLKAQDIPFRVSPNLVRGLDYYTHTVFEWSTTTAVGQQSSLGGGGRYNGLVEQLGGAPTPATGAGIGLDRILDTLVEQGINLPNTVRKPDLSVVSADQDSQIEAFRLVDELQRAGFSVDAALAKESMGSQLKTAARNSASLAIILGSEERSQDNVQLKDLRNGEQKTIGRNELIDSIKNTL